MEDSILIDGRYELIELLGQGVSGEVWAARQKSVDRTVAVKLLRDMDDERFAMRFVTEARAIAMLNHPNIVTLFDHGFDATVGTHFMVMEVIDGDSLVDAMYQPMSTEERVAIIRDVARALHHAHSHEILHRDLKPENIILAQQDMGPPVAKVLDFGLARILGTEGAAGPVHGLSAETTSVRITRKGDVQGTPAYMSPEQAAGELDMTPATDVYSLGIIMFEMLHGHLPFMHDDSWRVLRMQIHDDPPISESIPGVLAGLLALMLDKDRHDRPSAEDVATMLDSFLELSKADVSASMSLEEPSIVDTSMVYGDGFVLEEDEGTDRRMLLIPLIILLLIGGGLVYYLVNREPSTPVPPPEVQERVVIKEVPVEVVVEKTVEVPVPAPPVETASVDSDPEVGDAEVVQDAPSADTPRRSSARTKPRPTSEPRKKRPRRKKQSEGFETIKLKL